MCTASEQTHIQIENTTKAVTKVFKNAEKGKHENLLKIQQRKTCKYKSEDIKKIKKSMVIKGGKIIMKFPLHSKILKSHYAKDGRQERNAPIMRKKSVTQRSLHVCDISEVQKSKKINGL